ncbi:hypothetical protein [Hyphomicrobium sp.]|nr:hypothetical protein [Hyphomicrobium sp.]HRN87779.1 hypothetical protein [Hyphomicrobium sp.]HRQ27769.1 hypothetical protein [Hyphomicrobium sp.]
MGEEDVATGIEQRAGDGEMLFGAFGSHDDDGCAIGQASLHMPCQPGWSV